MATAKIYPDFKKGLIINEAEKNYAPVFTGSYKASAIRNFSTMEQSGFDLKLIENNNSYVRLFESFKKQQKSLSQLYNYHSSSDLDKLFSTTCSELLNLNPDKISVELTYTKSILFTFKKDGYTFFFERFFDNSEEGSDEVIYSAYYNKEKLPSFAGNFIMAITTIKYIFNPNQRIILGN